MTKSDSSTVPLFVSKKRKARIFYEHGQDALALAHSVANIQEEKALRKAEKHHQPQIGKSRAERRNKKHARDKRKRLEETKVMIASRRAEAKKEKAKCRKEAKGRLRRGDDAKFTVPEETASAAPRKRVSFAN